MDRRVLDEWSVASVGVFDGLAHDEAMETVDEIEWNGKNAIDKEGRLHTTLGGGILLRDREAAELAHRPALSDHGADGFGVRRVGEAGSLGSLVIVESIRSVLGLRKFEDRKDPPRLRRKIE